MSQEDPKSPRRRDFLNIAVGGSAVAFAAAMAYPAARFVQPRSSVDNGPAAVGKLEDFPIGGAKTVLFHDRPVLVLRGADGQLRAFSAICSHLHCIVGYAADKNQIECPCHQGVYSTDGQVLSGPPPRPLDELVVTINEGSVLLSTAG